MRISSLSLTNFRCFGPEAQTVRLKDLSTLVGTNGCGKSAVLGALVRLFSVNQSDWRLQRSDFHLPADKDWDEVDEATLRVEAELRFPELDSEDDTADAAAACFKHMTVKDTKGKLFCRIRLTGTWRKSSLPEGLIDQEVSWVMSPPSEDEEAEVLQPVLSHDRSRIHVHYIPATRDPARQIRQVSGSLLHTLLQAVQWSDETKQTVEEASKEIRGAFGGEKGVQEIQGAIESAWKDLHAAPEHAQVAIRPVSRRLEDLIRQVEATFSPGPTEREEGIDRLSDGQKSLFYLALMAALFDVLGDLSPEPDAPLLRQKLDPPILSVLAVEEPENHVAPHYLGRIMGVLRRIAGSPRGQVVVTSHSASILSRVEPREVQHLRTEPEPRTTKVTSIRLPKTKTEEYKFVREAVRAYPELYFARFAVLAEGDSEEVVIPRIAEALGFAVDRSFVSIVPLGGRHVNHFWRLLDALDIPHVTLLDLDRERSGGGWGRIKYAIDQLLELDASKEELLTVTLDGEETTVSETDFDGMADWNVSESSWLEAFIRRLEDYGVYFSTPLDLDFMMLRAFPEEYHAASEDGGKPRIPTEPKLFATAQAKAVDAVLKGDHSGGSTYDKEEQKAFFWYRYLFLGRGKPSTHLLALSDISSEDLAEDAPPVLTRVVEAMREAVEGEDASEADAATEEE